MIETHRPGLLLDWDGNIESHAIKICPPMKRKRRPSLKSSSDNSEVSLEKAKPSKPTRKQVHFSHAEVRCVSAAQHLTDDGASALWYSPQELEAISKYNSVIAKFAAVDPSNFGILQESIRGLEHLVSEAMFLRKIHSKLATLKAVLEEQNQQSVSGLSSDMADAYIAFASQQTSKKAVQRAIDQAAFDNMFLQGSN